MVNKSDYRELTKEEDNLQCGYVCEMENTPELKEKATYVHNKTVFTDGVYDFDATENVLQRFTSETPISENPVFICEECYNSLED